MDKPWWDEEIKTAYAVVDEASIQEPSFQLGYLMAKYEKLSGLYAAAKAAHAEASGELDRLQRAMRAVLRPADVDAVNEEADALEEEEVQHVG